MMPGAMEVEAAREALKYASTAHDVREAQVAATRAQAEALLAVVAVLGRIEYHLKTLVNEQ